MVPLRNQRLARCFLDRQQVHVVDHAPFTWRNEIRQRLLEQLRGMAIGKLLHVVRVQAHQRFDIRVGVVGHALNNRIVHQRLRAYAVTFAQNRGNGTQILNVVRVKEWNLAVQTARTLDVCVELVRTVGHHDEQHLTPVVRVRHELLQPGNNARRRSPIAVAAAFTVAKASVALVDDQRDGAHGTNRGQHTFQIGLGRAHPLGTEILQRQPREARFLQKSTNDERLARTHRTDGQQAHGRQTAVTGLDDLGDGHQLVLDVVVATNGIQTMARVHELDQTRAFLLDEGAFAHHQCG